eukprot:TRINITY_DN16197_c0_g5_i2.p1 TRINITY_DN16197_c0_g5~~TRINITY_DN16197_c0_g5_i2.p1  ORF type:complete len:773 (-),score=171.75 TRINITY_DN16197_c0_g5_i2:41-2323(-)
MSSGLSVSVKISFDDPLSGERIVVPVRGKSCSHAAVFDQQTYLKYMQDLPYSSSWKWKCPLCSNTVTSNELVVDPVVNSFIKLHPELDDAMFTECANESGYGFTLKAMGNPTGGASTGGIEVFDLSALEDELDAFDSVVQIKKQTPVVQVDASVVDLCEFDEPLSPQDQNGVPQRARAPRVGPRWGPEAQSKKKKNISGAHQIQVVDLTTVTLEQLGLSPTVSAQGALLESHVDDPNVSSAQTRLAELFDAVKDEYFVEELAYEDNFRQVWKGKVFCTEDLGSFKALLVELEESILFASFYSLWTSEDLFITLTDSWKTSVHQCQSFSEFACLMLVLKEMLVPQATFGIWNSSRGASWSDKVRDWIIYSDGDLAQLKSKFLGISFILLVNGLTEKCSSHGVDVIAPPQLSELIVDNNVNLCKGAIKSFAQTLPKNVFKLNWPKRFETWSSCLDTASPDRAAALLNVLESCLIPKFKLTNSWTQNCEAIMGIQLTGVEVVKEAVLALAEQINPAAFIDNWKASEAFAVWDGETFAIEGLSELKKSIFDLERALYPEVYEESWSSHDEKSDAMDIAKMWRHSLGKSETLPQVCTWLLYLELKIKRDLMGEEWATRRQNWYAPVFEIAMSSYLGAFDFVKTQTFVMYENIRPNFRTPIFKGLEAAWLDSLGRCTDGNIQVLSSSLWTLILALETPGQHRSTESKRVEWKRIIDSRVTVNQLAGILANYEEHILWDAVIQWWRLLRPQFIANLRWIRDSKPFTP